MRSNLHKIKLMLVGYLLRTLHRHDAQLAPVGPDKSYLRNTNPIVHTNILFYGDHLLFVRATGRPPYRFLSSISCVICFINSSTGTAPVFPEPLRRTETLRAAASRRPSTSV